MDVVGIAACVVFVDGENYLNDIMRTLHHALSSHEKHYMLLRSSPNPSAQDGCI